MAPLMPPKSPLDLSLDAKEQRDVEGEVAALLDAEKALTSASWYPPRAGDVITVHHERSGDHTAMRERYTVIEPTGGIETPVVFNGVEPDNELTRYLTGFYSSDLADVDDPVMNMWIEAGPARLTIERAGETVHDGLALWQ